MIADDDQLRAEMLGYDTCLISDALEKLALPIGVGAIRRLTTTRRIFGRAVTLKLEAFRGDVPKRHLGTAAIEAAKPGEIILVQHQARADCAGWGGLLSTAALAKGISGVVVDGLVRDVDESESLGLPVFARGATPVTARNKVVETATNVAIDFAGIAVAPGDFILADGSGVVAIQSARIGEVVQAARDMLALENGIRAALARGRSIGEAMSESYERAVGVPKK